MPRTRQPHTGGFISTPSRSLVRRYLPVRTSWRLVLVVLLLSLGGIVWLSQTSQLVSLGYGIQKLDREGTNLDRQAQVLQRQIADYENIARIQQEAAKMGMVPATKTVYMTVNPATPGAPIASDAALAAAQATAAAGRTNDKTAPIDIWWRELLQDLPNPYHDAAPPPLVTATPAPPTTPTPTGAATPTGTVTP